MARAIGILNHDHSYVHDQGVASNVWTVVHNMGRKPSITVVDSAGTVVEGTRNYVNNNIVIITFNAPFTGQAYLN